MGCNDELVLMPRTVYIITFEITYFQNTFIFITLLTDRSEFYKTITILKLTIKMLPVQMIHDNCC